MNSATATAPGRVNLLGEHTDYNDGFVLPAAIPQRTTVHVERIGGALFSLVALGQEIEFSLQAPPAEQAAKYVYGCLRELAAAPEARGATIPPLRLRVDSDVPVGVGLSSSAALEVATLRALRLLLALPLDDVRLAQLAQQAEIRHAGVNCGIMDQMASSLAQPGTMLFLDTRSLERRVLPLPADSEILVLDSGVARSLASSGYNERREQCRRAAELLGVTALRDIDDVQRTEALPETLRRRARHVVTENLRVMQAAQTPSAAQFGLLMNASHESLRADFEVSTPELDALVACLRAQPDIWGARLTGAGFGGACVALCRAGQARAAGAAALAGYPGSGRVLVG